MREGLGWWRHGPWMAGVLAAPLLHGLVNPEWQAWVSGLFGMSLLALAFEAGGGERRVASGWWVVVAVLLLVVPLLPLPPWGVQVLSPERWALERSFPLGSADDWVPLAVSRSDLMQRGWEVGIMVAGFLLGRVAGQTGVGWRGVAGVVLVAVVLLAGSDVLYRATGQERLLGVWETTWGKGAGTFANRNHFANWLYVGVLLLFGWWLRCVAPLRGARVDRNAVVGRDRALGWVLALAMGFGVTMAVLSGSRGGAIGMAAGVAVWAVLLGRRSRSRRRGWMVGAAALGFLVLLVGVGGGLLDRLAEARGDLLERYPKTSIWRESWLLFLRFPLTGVGLGGFLKAFNHYKGSGGEATVWHAENEPLQMLVETGLLGVLVLGVLLGMVVWAAVGHGWGERAEEPEMVFGALAGLAAFAVHGLVEFVLQTPANALLAAVMLGLVMGSRDAAVGVVVRPPPRRRRVVLNLGFGLGLAGVAVVQWVAAGRWQEARETARVKPASERAALVRESLGWWPWDSRRWLGWARLEVEALRGESGEVRMRRAEGIRAELGRALAWDPFNWELRLERAWLDLAFFRTTPRPRVTVSEAVRLNPLQWRIPLGFAESLVASDPEWARELLEGMDRTSLVRLQQIWPVALRLAEGPAACLALTPDTEEAGLGLARFGLERKLAGLAVAALDRLRGRVAAAELAGLYLQAQRADRALEVLSPSPVSAGERLLRARAYQQAGQWEEAIRWAERVWQSSSRRHEIEVGGAPGSDLESLREAWERRPEEVGVARAWAEGLAGERSPDLARLRELVGRFPRDLRMRWLVFEAERLQGRTREAAETALQLADLAARGR